MNNLFPDLPKEKFDIVYADPPWDYKGQLQHAGAGNGDSGGAIKHYPTVQLQDLKQLDVARISAKNSLLFMWSTNPHLDQAINLGNAWSFAWATVGFVWDKVKVNPGFYTMSQCELCLIFKRGKIPTPRGARNIRQLVREPKTRHSAKPLEVRHRIDAMFPSARKIELFARAPEKLGGGRRLDFLGEGSRWVVNIYETELRGRERQVPEGKGAEASFSASMGAYFNGTVFEAVHKPRCLKGIYGKTKKGASTRD